MSRFRFSVYRLLVMGVALVLAGCHQRINHGGRTPLVEVVGQTLYAEDLERVIPLGVSRDDSVLFAENYIRNWI